MANRVRFLVLVPLCAAVLMPGCKTSPTPAKVSGKITYNGSPIGGGSINFHPVTTEGGGNIMFNVKPDGTYEGVDLPVGDCVVTVETESLNPNPDRPKGEMAGGGGKFDPNDFMNKMKEAATSRAPLVRSRAPT